MVKPLYMVDSAQEGRILARVLHEAPRVPLFVVGDFNAAPWIRRMLSLKRRHNLLGSALAVPTWPSKVGMVGILIDHVHVSWKCLGGLDFFLGRRTWMKPAGAYFLCGADRGGGVTRAGDCFCRNTRLKSPCQSSVGEAVSVFLGDFSARKKGKRWLC